MKFFNAREETERSRRKLPHWQQGEVPVFVSFRLDDALPKEVLEPWLAARDRFIATHPPPWDEATENAYHSEFSDKIDDYLDAGSGCCALSNPQVCQIGTDRFHYFDQQRYHLWSYVIMPNHVHVLVSLNEDESLPNTLKGWKGVSSRMVHKAGLSVLSPFWQREYFDRLIRSAEHFEKVMSYIRDNPLKAGLAPQSYRLWTAE